jgi:uroporphyrinogen decarboxylase
MAPAAGRIRRQLLRATPRLDCTADGRIALLVQLARPGVPVLARLRIRREVRACLARIAPRDVDVFLEGRVAELGEPEPVLFDEIDREAVAPGRDRRAQCDGLPQRLARLHDALEWRAQAVPDDRVPALVEPVVAEKETVLRAARAPRGGARVLHLDRRELERARLHGRSLERPPVRDEGTGGVHGRASVRAVTEPLLVRAARREPVERTPVWFMRQAGRSLPEYRAIRERHSFFEVAGSPELCAEVTLQPVRRHNVDAAVLFADIVSPVLGMGIDVRLVEGVGPVVDRPVSSAADVARLHTSEPDGAILEAIRIVRGELDADKALVGFCGAPFTVAGYLVEGKPSRDFARTKALMYREPDTWHALLDVLAEQFAGYVSAQVAAGADVIQLFDSWIGALSTADYDEFVAPYSARILAAVDVPTIHFGTGVSDDLLRALTRAGGDVIGLDWRIPLDRGWNVVGEERGLQGNLDPAALLGPWERIEDAALDVLARAGGRPGHIFNLGHGVLPQTDPGVLTQLAGLVQERTVEARV